jgi:hypothetical protein
MSKPWTDGPRELIRHAVDHMQLGSDSDRRFAFISIDNGVELMVKTYLGLPQRARVTRGPSRRELDDASESFPALLNLLEKYDADKITGLSLDDIEWYHRLRNQMYHGGNGITVERSKVEAYLQLAVALFDNLFNEKIGTESASAVATKTGEFLRAWNELQDLLRAQLPDERGPALYRKMSFFDRIDPRLATLYESATRFRNELVHGIGTPETETIEQHLKNVAHLQRSLRRRGGA